MNKKFWACAEVYPGSGRPSRFWVLEQPEGERPDDENEDGEAVYPFNGMGGTVIGGPFDTESEAQDAIEASYVVDEGGWVYWK